MATTIQLASPTPLAEGRVRLEHSVQGDSGDDYSDPIVVPAPCYITAIRAALTGTPAASGLDLAIVNKAAGDPADPRDNVSSGLTSDGTDLASSRDPIFIAASPIYYKLGLDGAGTAEIVLEVEPIPTP